MPSKFAIRLPNAFICLLLICLLDIAFSPQGHSQGLSNREVFILYNSSDQESLALAEFYQKAREVPPEHMLGLPMPLRPDISRDEYEKTIVAPLRKHFETEALWARLKNKENLLMPTSSNVRSIVLMRGVPLRIQPTPPPDSQATLNPQDPIASRSEASVDSELALFGVESLPTLGVLKNSFFESKSPINQANIPFQFLTARIDAPTLGTCKRMISDAIATEKTSLWGRTYIDIANKFPQGDEWLEEISTQSRTIGIPTIVDRFPDTLPKNYPLTEAAMYYGWYDWNVSGPFLNPRFTFRQGAIAVHLHSFSGQQLTDPHQNWCAPLLARGAAATLGNVYEPYLHLSHHFDIFHTRLLDGWTLVEAAWAAMPVASWQGVVLGDPLYRPFLHIGGTGTHSSADRDFRALAAAARQWPDNRATRLSKIGEAAEKLKSGAMAESIAHEHLAARETESAQNWLQKAKEYFPEKSDKLRQDLSLIAIKRQSNNRQSAIADLRAAQQTYQGLSEAESISGWLDILDPPPPPIADPTQIPE